VPEPKSKRIEVRTYKYDGAAHRSWPAQVQYQDGPLLVLDAEFEQAVEHDLLGRIACGTISTEYYWLDRWYNVFRFAEPAGPLKSFYCNVNVPPVFDGTVLSYIDLDLDVLVKPDLSYQVLDLDEFETNAARYGYPAELRRNAQAALAELIGLIDSRAFPFGVR